VKKLRDPLDIAATGNWTKGAKRIETN